MSRHSPRLFLLIHLFLVLVTPGTLSGQVVSQRGFVEARGQLFPQTASNDPTRAVGDFLAREEVFVKPASWLRLAGGLELRANSHDQVEQSWQLDVWDRTPRRPRASVRRATATITGRRLTLDVGKQFIRWGKTDIVNPTDRFAPRDFLNVVDGEFLAVTGARAVLQAGAQHTFEVVWQPRFTPSRVPLLDQRWTVIPPQAPQVQIVDRGALFPSGGQTGFRWSRVGALVEYSLSFFDGFNHLPAVDTQVLPMPSAAASLPGPFVPEVDVQRVYPAIRSYGFDAAMPTPWFTLKGEMAYFTSSSPLSDEYVLFVLQIERTTGEWVLVGGYAGEAVTDRRAGLVFAPDRGLTRSAVGRASYTIDTNRSIAFEAAIRQNLDGAYVKTEYSQTYGQHWRATISSAFIRGDPDDFLGQYRRNSHLSLVLRYSF